MDLTVGGLIGICTFLLLHPLLPIIISSISWRKAIQRTSGVLIVFSALSLIFALLFVPVYSPLTPRRMLVQHVHDLDAGEAFILFVPADSVPLTPGELPPLATEQTTQESLNRYHGLLPTVPSLKPSEGRRWELVAPFISPPVGQRFQVIQQDRLGNFELQIDAPIAFCVEILIYPAVNIQSVDTMKWREVEDMQSLSDEAEYRLRLFDGSGNNSFRVHLSITGPVNVEFLANHIDPLSPQVVTVMKNIPTHIQAVASVLFRSVIPASP